MSEKIIPLFKTALTTATLIFMISGMASALNIDLVPSNVQRAPGSTVRINIHTSDATDLISMGILVSFDPAVLQASAVNTGDTGKYLDCNDGWIMDADGDCATTADQFATPDVEVDNTAGTVFMIGGRIKGSATDGLDDPIIGWITFTVVGSEGQTSDLSVNFAHPDSIDYEHFVMLDGTLVDSTYSPAVEGAICVDADPCDGNVNGDDRANVLDLGVMRSEFGNNRCNDPGPGCQSDVNNDGIVNVLDLGILRGDFGRIDCSCP